MLVTFISECQKNAIQRTRRVLDAFANRIGSNTWQSPITQEGLDAVKKLLKKTAIKNTAVSCHLLKSRVRTELLWVVGNKNKFNNEGFVAVNYTEKNILKNYYENDWRYLPLIKALTVFAALLHDFGKASVFFQKKLKYKQTIKGDPLRHEFVSVLFLLAIVDGKTDNEWLKFLMVDNIHEEIAKLKICKNEKPLAKLPPLASMIAWLILTHHKMPCLSQKKYGNKGVEVKALFNLITLQWGYQTSNDEDFKKYLKECLEYSELPSQSLEWQAEIKHCANELKDNLEQFAGVFENSSLRAIMLYSRLSLMLGDHYYSSLPKNDNWISTLGLYANTDDKGKLKQQLDEHLVGVAKQASLNVMGLPEFEGVFDQNIRIENNSALQQKSPGKYQWQDKSVAGIKEWRKNEQNLDKQQFGFFAINMASTGTGKTFANAKIMQALSPDENSLRYILALGLRTLTLQTGDEYTKKIKLNREELAILIGSSAILNLHNQDKETFVNEDRESGSESKESLSDGKLIFDGSFSEDSLDTILLNKKHRQFLHAPVLVCTIDHIIKATETTRGGKYILPTLRLMSSDLVIDEVDDFDDEDLIAIGRLIHLAGMLGRKVMLSSATIPPDLAEGYFNAYKSGWLIFAKMRNKNQSIGCAWIDEFKTIVKSISSKEDYQKKHDNFIEKHVYNLHKERAKRKVNIVKYDVDKEYFPENYFSIIKTEIGNKHEDNCFIDEKTKKKISVGVVRMANVKPCIKLTKFLLNNPTEGNVEIKAMPYHSRQVLLMRHAQEKYLDKILKRNKDQDDGDNKSILEDKTIRDHIDGSNKNNIAFVLVATPVEEVGRDHDFDWAIIEPSSYRSFIQLAGRVLRHRNQAIIKPNIAILQYNYRTIEIGGREVEQHHQFQYPGYQKKSTDLSTFDLEELINIDELAKRLDATKRIIKPKDLQPKTNLADLEHTVIAELLTNYKQIGASTMQGWLDDCWWLSGIHQQHISFRKSNLDEIQFLTIDNGFCSKSKGNKAVPQNNIKAYELSPEQSNNLWFKRDYEVLLKAQAGDEDIEKTALIYGEITLMTYGNVPKKEQFIYNPQLGLCDNN